MVSCQGSFANIVTTVLAVALAKAKQITPLTLLAAEFFIFYDHVLRIQLIVRLLRLVVRNAEDVRHYQLEEIRD